MSDSVITNSSDSTELSVCVSVGGGRCGVVVCSTACAMSDCLCVVADCVEICAYKWLLADGCLVLRALLLADRALVEACDALGWFRLYAGAWQTSG